MKSQRSGSQSKRDSLRKRKSNLILKESERLLYKHLKVDPNSISSEYFDQETNNL